MHQWGSRDSSGNQRPDLTCESSHAPRYLDLEAARADLASSRGPVPLRPGYEARADSIGELERRLFRTKE